MTGALVFLGVWLGLAVAAVVALGRAAARTTPTPPFPPEPELWLVPDTVAGLEAELPQGGAR